MIQKNKIKSILLISLSNIGDVILTFPVIDILKNDFPNTKLSIIVGPKAKTLLENNPNIDKVIAFDKHQSFFKTIKWILKLRKEKYDFVVDLRNTAISFFIFPKYRTPFHNNSKLKKNLHMKDRHVERLKTVYSPKTISSKKQAIFISKKDEQVVDIFIKNNIGVNDKFVIVAPGAADEAKRWGEINFAKVSDYIIEKFGLKIFLVGGKGDVDVTINIMKLMKHTAVNLTGKITLLQLASLYKKCALSIGNDSSPMHLASYLDIPSLAIFGPTDPDKYGPWGKHSSLVYCNKIDKRMPKNEWMNCIELDKVITKVTEFLNKLNLDERI